MNLFHKHDASEGLRTGYKSAGELGHSQFGTPLNQIVHALSDDSDPAKWIIVPTAWGDYPNESPEQWANLLAPIVWGAWVESTPGAAQPAPEVIAQTALTLKGFGEKFGGFDRYRLFAIVTYLYHPDPRQFPIATRVWVDDHPDLTAEQAAGVDDQDALEKPVVEPFHTDALGTGLKVTRHGTLDKPHEDIEGTGIFVTVRYAFKLPGRQAVVTVSATDTDLGRMAAAQDDLDEFVRTINLLLADGTPVDVTDP